MRSPLPTLLLLTSAVAAQLSLSVDFVASAEAWAQTVEPSAGAEHAGRTYLLVGANAQGITSHAFGLLDGSGRGETQVVLEAQPELAGVEITFIRRIGDADRALDSWNARVNATVLRECGNLA